MWFMCCIFMSTATSLPGALQTAKASLEPRTDFLDFARLANTSCEREGPSTSTWFKENTAQSSRIALGILGRAPCCFAEMKAFGLLTGANGANILGHQSWNCLFISNVMTWTCFFSLAFQPRCNSGVVFVWLGTLEGSLRNNSTCLRKQTNLGTVHLSDTNVGFHRVFHSLACDMVAQRKKSSSHSIIASMSFR